MSPPVAVGLFALTALAEIVGCWLVWLWARQQASAWWLVPAAAALAVFAWLLTLHPAASGRVYAAYGGVYVTMAVVWLWAVDGIRPDPRACLISPHAPRCVAAARQGSSVAQRQTGRLVKRRAGAGGPLRRNPEG
jgi:small multidrug resistance family-3 protein